MSEVTTQQQNEMNFIYPPSTPTLRSKQLQQSNSSSIIENQLPFKNKEKKVKLNGLENLKKLYPNTDIDDLPLAWSTKDKASYITLSDNNLKVHYKGIGKGQKDAASVRAEKPIPQSCLLYYYEIKVICKGRDGYMGIGLAAENVNLQRLPGWDKHSYGYHGDDGHSFSSSGTGKQYGPTFTTDDVIGCGYNIVENKCFYTKNGFSLGDAFEDLVNLPLYPTVGLQTPGEEIEANFGLQPFKYDIKREIEAVKEKLTSNIINFPVKYNEWQYTINKIIQTWLIHNGYYNTAEVFSNSSKQDFKVNVNAIKRRLKIQQSVLSGKIGEAIELTNKYYPTVLKENPNLLFALKCRQFIEMINGFENVDAITNDQHSCVSNGNSSSSIATGSTSTNSTISRQQQQLNNNNLIKDECLSMEVDDELNLNNVNSNNLLNNELNQQQNNLNEDGIDKALFPKLNELNKNYYNSTTIANSTIASGRSTATSTITSIATNNGSTNNDKQLEHKPKKTKNSISNSSNSNLVNNTTTLINNFIKRDSVASKLPQLLEFGKDLHTLSQQLAKEYGPNIENEKMLCDAFSLIAYADPSESSISWQLKPSEREQVCLQLNNAIIKSDKADGCCQIPPLEAIIKQTKTVLRLNGNFGAWLIDKL